MIIAGKIAGLLIIFCILVRARHSVTREITAAACQRGCPCSHLVGEENQACGWTLRIRYRFISAVTATTNFGHFWYLTKNVLHHEYLEYLISQILPSAVTSQMSNTACPNFKG